MQQELSSGTATRESRCWRSSAGVLRVAHAYRHLGKITDSKRGNKEFAARRTAAMNTTKALGPRVLCNRALRGKTGARSKSIYTKEADAPGWNVVEHISASVEVAQWRARGTSQEDFGLSRAAKRR